MLDFFYLQNEKYIKNVNCPSCNCQTLIKHNHITKFIVEEWEKNNCKAHFDKKHRFKYSFFRKDGICNCGLIKKYTSYSVVPKIIPNIE